MTEEQVKNLVNSGTFPDAPGTPELIETHISWVIIGRKFVYKIKKPVHYSFLDYSTVEMRKYFCNREIELNERLSEKLYIDVLPIKSREGTVVIDGKEGDTIDYAVRMHKLNRSRQMDRLLRRNKVTASDIKNLAGKVAFFHKNATIIYNKELFEIAEKFRDLETEAAYLGKNSGAKFIDIIKRSTEASDSFMNNNERLLASRLASGFTRDCHGDLHSRNIFLLPAPLPFDCIEFNDDFRQIDVLNEVAFLCMDLDAFGKSDLSELFIQYYNEFFPTIESDNDQRLFVYYKSYRANVRAKVNSLRAKTAVHKSDKIRALASAEKYLYLMNGYINTLKP